MVGRYAKKTVSIKGTKDSAIATARTRVVMMSAIFVLAYVVIAARVIDIAVIQPRLVVFAEQQDDQSGESQPQQRIASRPKRDEGPRADILDRNGVLLATSLKTQSLYADPKLIAEPDQVASDLIKIFPDLNYERLAGDLNKDRRFVWVKRNLTPHQQSAVLNLGYPGLAFKEEYRRVYPQGRLGAHVVGYTNVDGNGLAGVERSFNTYLFESDDPLYISLDTRVQYVLEQNIKAAIDSFEAKAGAGLIMDVKTGEVVAAASLPDFNPNMASEALANNLFNRFSVGVYELGSGLKIFSTAAYIEDYGAKMDSRFDARKPLKRGRFTIHDYHAKKRYLTMAEVFIHSSNIGTALMGEKVGTSRLKEFYKDLGFTQSVPTELHEIAKPLVPQPWRDINTVTVSYGHGIAITPLHLVRALSSVVNGGYLITPTFRKTDEAKSKKETVRMQVVSEETSEAVKQLLRLTVQQGTGGKADIAGYEVGGKTGTAEKIVNGRYDKSKLISSFLGVFPMSNPRYAIFVMVDEPKGQKHSYGYATAGWVAAPAVGDIVEKIGPLLGVAPSPATAPDISNGLLQYVYDDDGQPLAQPGEMEVMNASY